MERFECLQILKNTEIILILLCCLDGSNGQTCSPNDCHKSYFSAPLILTPDETCYGNGVQVQLDCPPGYILNGPDWNACSFGTWILPPSVCEDDPDYNPKTSPFGTSSTNTSMTSEFETTSLKSTSNTTFVITEEDGKTNSTFQSFTTIKDGSTSDVYSTEPTATSLNATTQLKTEKPATSTQKTIIAETTPQHQPTRIEEATLMETTQVVTMPWRTLMLTSTTEDKNTIYDKITPEVTTTGKITGLQATTNHYETTNDSPTRYKATTPDMTKTDEATALHVTSRAVTNDASTTYDATIPNTTGDTITSVVTTSGDSTTTDTKTTYDVTTPVMTSTYNTTTLHLISNGLATTNERTTTHDATTPDTTSGRIPMHTTASSDLTTPDMKTGYDVATPVMTSTDKATTLHLISNGLSITNEPTTSHDATAPDTTGDRITSHVTTSSDSTTTDTKTKYDVSTPVMTSTDNAATLHLISNGFATKTEITTSYDATTPDTTVDRITSYVTTSRDSTTTDTKTTYDLTTPVMTSTDNTTTLHLISNGLATTNERTTTHDATTPDATSGRITMHTTASSDSTTPDMKTGYDVATPVMTSTDNAATLHLISSGFATKNEITTSYDATTPDTTGDRITSHVTTSRDSTTTDTKTKDDVSTPVMTSTDNAATLHLISSGFATKNEITTSYDATTPDTTGDRITSHITRSRGSATTDAKTRYYLTTPVMTSTDNATTFHLISNSLATTNEPSTRHEVTTAGMSTEAKSTTLHATTSSVTSTDIKASLGLSTTEYLSTKSTTRKREETTIKSTIAVTTLPNLINMERRFVLPHLALEVELLTYFLGFMDTDLSNSSITQVQTTTGDTFGSFFGGLVNSFKYATPSRFYDTVERSSFEIQSTGDIHMYMSTINSTSQFLCYPVDALSTDYIVSVPNINTKSSFIITATEGDTEVSVFFPRDFFYGGNTYNFERALRLTLNDLQTVVFNATFDVTGTYIKSSKPVSLVAEVQWDSHLSIQPYLSTFYLPPIENWGMKYSLRSYFGGFNQIHITASQNNTVITMKVSELINEIKKILNAWNSYKYNCSRDCLVEIESSRPIMVLQTECPTDGYCNTMVTPSTTQAVTQEVPVFVSTYLVGNLGVWVSNGNYDNIKVDNQTVMWDVIRNGVFVEATVDKGYHFISSSNGEQQFLVTVDKTVYAAHSTHSGTNYKACLFDRVFISGVEVTFQATTPGNSVGSLEKCKEDTTNADQFLATRRCGEDLWEKPELLNCYSPEDLEAELQELAKTNVTEENVEEVAQDVALVTSQDPESLTSSEIVNVADSLESIAETGSSSPEVTDSVIGTVNNIMEVEEEELQKSQESSSNIVMSLEQQVTNVQKNPSNFTEVQDNVGVRAIKVNPNITYAITFVILSSPEQDNRERLYTDLSEENTVLFNEKTEVKAQNSTTSIFVPPRVLEVAKEADSNLREIPISFLIYKDARLFQTSSPNLYNNGSMTIREEIISQVVSATLEMENVSINNLEEDSSVISRFTTIDQTNGNVIEEVCVFWDVTAEKWSDVGCKTDTESSTTNQTVCYCEHLTSFAVLMRLDVTTQLPKYLDYITWIGSSLSVIGLIACIMTLTCVKRLRQKQSSQIHINLCLSLIGFNICFMAGDLAINHPTHCKNIATATHFFCLATFAWMSAEAINMYLVFVKIGKPRLEYFLLVSCVLTYGLSVAIALIVFLLTEEEMFSNYCFLHPGYSLYFGLILEIFLLLVLNTVIFILVIKKVVFRPILSTSARNNKKKEVVARIQQFILFWVLLGLSWTFGFLTLIPNRLTFAFELLFCIFISLQGVVLSIFIFMKNPEVRNSLRKAKERLSMKSSNALSNDSTGSSSHSKFNVILLRFTHRKSVNNDKSSKSTSSL